MGAQTPIYAHSAHSSCTISVYDFLSTDGTKHYRAIPLVNLLLGATALIYDIVLCPPPSLWRRDV